MFSPKPVGAGGLYQQSMTTPIANKPFDEAMEFSQSDDDDSAPDNKHNKNKKAPYGQQQQLQAGEKGTPTSGTGGGPSMITSLSSSGQSPSKQQQQSSFQSTNQVCRSIIVNIFLIMSNTQLHDLIHRKYSSTQHLP